MSAGPLLGSVAAGVIALGGGAYALLAAAGATDPTVLTTGGIGGAVVGSLLYLVKRMTDGSLVSIKVDDLLKDATKREDRLRHEAETRDDKLRAIADHVNADAEVREAKLRDLAKRGQDREDLLWALLRGKGAVDDG